MHTEHTNIDGFFLHREHQRMLLEILRRIPDLSIELAISETKQTRIGARLGGKQQSLLSEQPFPFSQAAIDAAENLHTVLGSWVKHVCEHRSMVFEPINGVSADFVGPLKPKQWRIPAGYTPSTTALARWLDRHIISLALTPGAEASYGEIKQAVQWAVWIVCPPPEQIIIDMARVEQARRLKLSAADIATLAKELGEEYRHLTVRRVQVLREAGKLKPAISLSKAWRPDWPTLYLVGQAMDAHLAHPIRQRHTKPLPA